MIRFHVKGLLALAAFAALLIFAVDVRLGIAAILAATVIDCLSLALPLGLWHERARAAAGADGAEKTR